MQRELDGLNVVEGTGNRLYDRISEEIFEIKLRLVNFRTMTPRF